MKIGFIYMLTSVVLALGSLISLITLLIINRDVTLILLTIASLYIPLSFLSIGFTVAEIQRDGELNTN